MQRDKKLTSDESWQIFTDIMRAVKQDGGSVTSVDELMAVAEEIGQRIKRMEDWGAQQLRYALGIIAAAPTPDEMDLLWERYRGPGVPRPAPDPKWLKGYMPWRLEDTDAGR